MVLTKKAITYKKTISLCIRYDLFYVFHNYKSTTTQYWKQQYKLVKHNHIERHIIIKKLLHVLPHDIEIEIYKFLL